MFFKNRGEIFDVFISFTIGLFAGSYSLTFELTILFLITYEFFLFIYTCFLPTKNRFIARLSSNCSYLLGWIMGRWLITGKTGFEKN